MTAWLTVFGLYRRASPLRVPLSAPRVMVAGRYSLSESSLRNLTVSGRVTSRAVRPPCLRANSVSHRW